MHGRDKATACIPSPAFAYLVPARGRLAMLRIVALIAALIAVAIIGGGRMLGQQINSKFTAIATQVQKA